MSIRSVIGYGPVVGASFAFLFHEEFDTLTITVASLWVVVAFALVNLKFIARDRTRPVATVPPARDSPQSTPCRELPMFTLLTFHGVRPNGVSVPFSLDVKGEEIVLAVQHTN